MERKIRKLNKNQIIALCLVVVAVLGIYIYNRAASDKRGKEKPMVEVGTCEIKKADMHRHIVLAGQTVSDANIPLAPQYAGKVVAVNVNLGDVVKKGDILVVQDTASLNAEISKNEAETNASGAETTIAEASFNANYSKAKAAYEITKSQFERDTYLESIGAVSKGELDSTEQLYLVAKAEFEVLENQRMTGLPASVAAKEYTAEKNRYATDMLKQKRDDMSIVAPRDGIIGFKDVEVGAYVSAGTKILSLVDNNHMFVDCTITENDAALLNKDMPVKVFVDAIGQEIKGKIVYVSPAVDTANKSFVARIELENTGGKIKSGLFARSELDILQREDTIFVPREAVVVNNGRAFIYVLKPDNTVEERDIQIGLINDTDEEIISGVEVGEIVVINNQDRLKNGIKVKLASAK